MTYNFTLLLALAGFASVTTAMPTVNSEENAFGSFVGGQDDTWHSSALTWPEEGAYRESPQISTDKSINVPARVAETASSVAQLEVTPMLINRPEASRGPMVVAAVNNEDPSSSIDPIAATNDVLPTPSIDPIAATNDVLSTPSIDPIAATNDVLSTPSIDPVTATDTNVTTSVYGCWRSRDPALLASTCKCKNPCQSAAPQDIAQCRSAVGDRFRRVCGIVSNCTAEIDDNFPCELQQKALGYADITCPEQMRKRLPSAKRCQHTEGGYWADGSSRCSETNRQEIKVCTDGEWAAMGYPSSAVQCYAVGNVTGTGEFTCPYFQSTTFTIMAAYEENGLEINGRVAKYNFDSDVANAADLKQRGAVVVPCSATVTTNCLSRAELIALLNKSSA